ncbi:hypothetical protein ACO0OL_001609 [Hanseniaspora opuntiae]
MDQYGNHNGYQYYLKNNEEIFDLLNNDDLLRKNVNLDTSERGMHPALQENLKTNEFESVPINSYESEFAIQAKGNNNFLDPSNISNSYNSEINIKQEFNHNPEIGTYEKRAFRRRKEEKLKEMEQKWMDSENDKKQLLKQIEELKKTTYEMSIENKELQKKNLTSSSDYKNMSSTSSISHSPNYNFPNKAEYVQYIYAGSPHEAYLTQIKDIKYLTDEGEAMTVSKTWDYLFRRLQEKELEGYTFDTWQIMSLMKGHEVCHGSGAAYMKSFVDSLINANVKEL